MKIYLAAPVVGISEEQKTQINSVSAAIAAKYPDRYEPSRLKIPNAWNMPQNEWARCVFTCDVIALEEANAVVVCDFGRKDGSAGTAWEAGYAFAKGKPIVLIRMPGVQEQSLMLTSAATIAMDYDIFLDLDCMPRFEELRNIYKETKNEVTLN